jgi:tetratricopeptide (TPR) repeat protein
MNVSPTYYQSPFNSSRIVQVDIQSRWKKLRLLPTKTHTLERCRTLVKNKEYETFREERINWMRAIHLHSPQTAIEIAELLFEWYFADPDIERAEVLTVWQKLLQSVDGSYALTKSSASLWRQMGILQGSRGYLEEAELHLRKALELSVQLQNLLMIGNSYYELGLIYRNTGDYQRAREAFNNSMANSAEAGNLKALIYAKGQLANVLAVEGDLNSAINLLEECLETWEQFLDPAERNMAHTTLHTLGRTYVENGQYVEAVDALKKSLALKAVVTERFDTVLRTRALLAEAFCNLGQPAQARNYLGEADIERCVKMGSYLYAASAFKTLSQIFFLEKNFLQAERMANRALDSANQSNNPHTQFDILLWIFSSNFRRMRLLAIVRHIHVFLNALFNMHLSPWQFARLVFRRLNN